MSETLLTTIAVSGVELEVVCLDGGSRKLQLPDQVPFVICACGSAWTADVIAAMDVWGGGSLPTGIQCPDCLARYQER